MKTNEVSEIRSRLWRSVEMGCIRGTVLLAAPLLPLGVLLLWWVIHSAGLPAAPLMGPVTVVLCLLTLPALGFWLWRMGRILWRPEAYIFCQSELTQPHSYPLNRNSFAFMAVIESAEGKRFAVETHSIFKVRNIPGPKMRDYVGRTVTLAWNPRTDMVVVIG